MSKTYEHDRHEQAIMDFRQSIVAELANPYLAHGELKALIKTKAAKHYEIPGSSKQTVTEATVKKWLASYRQYGKEGLRPKKRNDSGSSRSVSSTDVQVFSDFIRENPRLTASTAWKKLLGEGKVSAPISKSSLSRLLAAHGLTREERLQEAHEQKQLKFDFFYPLECVQADCLHGPLIPGPGCKATKAILIAFIDDATRRIVYAEFTSSEHSLAFEKGIRHILASQGQIGRLYVDNGSTFVSTQTSRILDTLQIHLVHSTPHRPQGRGKIERFFRTVRENFLRPLDVSSITGFEDLNIRFRTWLEAEYHRRPHKGLRDGMTPLEAWNEKARHLKVLSPAIDLDAVFYHECQRRVAKDQTITIGGTLFEAPPILIGKRVTLRYNPHKVRNSVEAVYDGKSYGSCRLVDSYANTKVKRSTYNTQAFQDCTVSGEASPVQASLAAALRTGGAL